MGCQRCCRSEGCLAQARLAGHQHHLSTPIVRDALVRQGDGLQLAGPTDQPYLRRDREPTGQRDVASGRVRCRHTLVRAGQSGLPPIDEIERGRLLEDSELECL